jgi:hypothetical protein
MQFTRQKVAIPKNNMFYIDGKFGRNKMKIKEVESYWFFLTGLTAAFLNYVFHV